MYVNYTLIKCFFDKQCQASSRKSDVHINYSSYDSHLDGKWAPQGCLACSVLKNKGAGVAWTLNQEEFGEKRKGHASGGHSPGRGATMWLEVPLSLLFWLCPPGCPQGAG